MVALPVPEVLEPVNKLAGIDSVPVSVPPGSVMVKGAVGVAEITKVPLNDPSPISVSFAVPVAEMAPVERLTDAVALTVSVVFVVAAWAATQITNPIAKFLRVRVMCAFRILRSSIVRGKPDESG
jgi:hypothetical protein